MAISNNKRDLSKLVKVQRAVTRGGKTFMQNFYVNPSQVKATDRVIGGQQNLLPKPPAPTPSAGSATLDVAYFDSLAQTDRSKALDYLKSCGITWKENAHAGINWMRAKQAMKASQGISNTTNKVSNGLSQNSGSGLNQQQKDTINADLSKATSSKEKVSTLKKHLGVNGCTQLAESLGVTWKKDSNEAINWMRASMALKKYIEAGGDLKLGDISATAPNTSTTTATKKDKVVDKPKEDDKLKIGKNATERQKNIINLLNNISDPELLKSYTTVGMVAEDDTSKDFILKKLLPKYQIFLKSQNKGTGSRSANSKEFANILYKRLKLVGCFESKANAVNGLENIFKKVNTEDFINPENYIVPFINGVRIQTDTNDYVFRKTPEEIISYFYRFFSQYSSNEYPQGYDGENTKIYESLYDIEKDGVTVVLRNLQQNHPELSDACDDMIKKYDEAMKICHGNPRLLKIVLSTGSYGEVLPKPADGDDSAKAGKMWREFFKPFMQDLTHTSFIGGNSEGGIAHVSEMFKELDNGYDSLLDEFKKQGVDDKSIFATLFQMKNTFKPQSLKLDALPLYDKQGNATGKTLSLPKKFLKFESTYLECIDTKFIEYFCAKFVKDNNVDTDYVKDLDSNLDAYDSMSLSRYLKTRSTRFMEAVDCFKQYGNFSKEDYANIHTKINDMFGISFKKKDDTSGETVKIKDMDLNNFYNNLSGISSRLYDVVPTKDTNKKAVLTNVKCVINNLDANILANNSVITDFYKRSSNSKEFLKSIPTYSMDDLQKIKGYFSKDYNPKTGAGFDTEGINVLEYDSDNPLKRIAYDYTKCLALNSENLLKKMDRDKVNKLWDKVFDLSPMSGKKQDTSSIHLKELRLKAFDAIHCTISTESESESEKLRKEFLDDWDYKDGVPQKTPDGIIHTTRVYSGKNSFKGKDRRALFNSRFFKVNNSNMEENFNDYQKKLKSDGSPSESEVLNLYHACSYAATAGILGKVGGWFMGNEFTKTAKALGTGAYFGFKGGKSAVYCGEGTGGYHNLEVSGSSGDNANGCYIMASVMRGKNNKDSKSDHGQFKDYELVVKNNACIKPNYFVDISSRALGVNVNRDSNGNYVSLDGNVTHDKTGKAIDMK